MTAGCRSGFGPTTASVAATFEPNVNPVIFTKKKNPCINIRVSGGAPARLAHTCNQLTERTEGPSESQQGARSRFWSLFFSHFPLLASFAPTVMGAAALLTRRIPSDIRYQSHPSHLCSDPSPPPPPLPPLAPSVGPTQGAQGLWTQREGVAHLRAKRWPATNQPAAS